VDRVGAVSVGPLLPRRTALTLAAAGLVAVTGCDDGDQPTPAPTPTPDPDVALVDHVLAELAAAQRLTAAVGDADLTALHRAHIEALDGAPPKGRLGDMPRTDAVRRAEQKLQKHLESAALAAESGALARLLASMSAAVSQRLA
jgi:hypothetical protein